VILSALLNCFPSCGSGYKRGVQFLQLFPCTVQVVEDVVVALLTSDADADAAVVDNVAWMAFAD